MGLGDLNRGCFCLETLGGWHWATTYKVFGYLFFRKILLVNASTTINVSQNKT